MKNPDWTLLNEEDYGLQVPCGKCLKCRHNYVSEWVFRLQAEAELSYSAKFVTLTYNDQTLNQRLTKNGYQSLIKKDLQQFFKRLRKFQDDKKGEKIKYYACGEYGSNTQRPHYHAIIFNMLDSTINNLQSIWSTYKGNDMDNNPIHIPIGHIRIDHINSNRLAYVTGYTMKSLKDKIKFNREDGDDREVEFNIMSKFLGVGWLTENRQRFLKEKLNPYIITEDGKKQRMPRYYKKKVFTDQERMVLNERAREYAESTSDNADAWTRRERKLDYIQRTKRRQLNQKNQL